MSRIVNIMPMAGLGKRFFQSSFNLPKPLIKIQNKPMFIKAAKSMPKSNLNIFICNKKFFYAVFLSERYFYSTLFPNKKLCVF